MMPESIEIVAEGGKGPECHLSSLPECSEHSIDVESVLALLIE